MEERKFRVLFTVFFEGPPREVEREYDNEEDAQRHFSGLQSITADHEFRSCGEHIYNPRLESRRILPGEWATVATCDKEQP
jgi:hypothetical protein